MTSVKITVDAANANAFLVELTGKIKRPKALNDALGRRLASELQEHFRTKNKVPNKLGGTKTNFWNDISAATVMTEATAKGATVTIGEARFRIHLEGGTIKPTGARKALTIPLIAGAHGKRVSDYQKDTGKKLFRIGSALFERSDSGDRSLTGATRVSARGRGNMTLKSKSQIRPVYALVKKVTIKRDPKALPPKAKLIEALNQTAEHFLNRELKKGGLA